MHITSEFPQPTSIGGRHFFARHEVENYKRKLMGLTPTERDPVAPITFVTAQQLSDELQINRRTLGRRIRGRIRGEAAHTPSDSAQPRPEQRPASSQRSRPVPACSSSVQRGRLPNKTGKR